MESAPVEKGVRSLVRTRKLSGKSPSEQKQILTELFEKGLNMSGAAKVVGLTRQAIEQKVNKYGVPYNKKAAREAFYEKKRQEQREQNRELFEKIVGLLDQGYDITKVGRILFGNTRVHRSRKRMHYYEKVARILRLFDYKPEIFVSVDGAGLRAERLKQGLLQADLGFQPQISNFERGGRGRRRTIERIARRLNVPVDELLIED